MVRVARVVGEGADEGGRAGLDRRLHDLLELSAPNGTTCWRRSGCRRGRDRDSGGSAGALPGVASEVGREGAAAARRRARPCPRTAAGLAGSKAASSTSRPSTGAENGTGKQSSSSVVAAGGDDLERPLGRLPAADGDGLEPDVLEPDARGTGRRSILGPFVGRVAGPADRPGRRPR